MVNVKQEKKRRALLLGATGLVGRFTLQYLLESPYYQEIIALTRRKLDIDNPKLLVEVIDFNNLDRYSELYNVDDAFCCLGTTIKTAGSKAAFRQVDLIYPVEIARLCKEKGTRTFSVISAIGANAGSKIFYNQTKGEMEAELTQLSFESLLIYRPSLLVGKRREFRFGEKVASIISPILSPFFLGPLKKYQPIRAESVAAALVANAANDPAAVTIYESDQIK
jgi:uncharacterized protein YbjT (DUF2867 family)